MSNVDLCSTGGNAFVSAVSVQVSFVDNFSCIHCPVGTDRRCVACQAIPQARGRHNKLPQHHAVGHRCDHTEMGKHGKRGREARWQWRERERERHLLAKDVADLDGRTPLSLAEKGLLNHLNGCGMQPCARFLAEFSDFFNGRERT